jgi:hypothetical protein
MRPRSTVQCLGGLAAVLFAWLPIAPAQATEIAIHPLGITGETADLATDSQGRVHLVWVDGGWLNYGQVEDYLVVGQQTVSSGVSAGEFRPRIAVRADGASVHLAWVSFDHKSLYHSWRGAAGQWSTETVWPSSGDLVYYYPASVVDLTETVHIICGQAHVASNSQIFYARKPDGGTWTTVPLSPPAGTGTVDWRDTAMATDLHGGVHARYATFNSFLRYHYAPSGGSLATSTMEPVPAMADGTSNGEGDIFVSLLGGVHLSVFSWTSGVNMVNVDHVLKPAGEPWAPATRASIGHVTDINPPSVAESGDGQTYVSWTSAALGAVLLSVFGDTGWGVETVDAAAHSMTATKTTLAATKGAIWLLWKGGDGGWVLGEILTPTLSVASPNGGETWSLGTHRPITWSSSKVTEPLRIVLLQGETEIGTIAENIAADSGSHDWTIGTYQGGIAPASSGYRIRITAMDGLPQDASDGAFDITTEVDSGVGGTGGQGGGTAGQNAGGGAASPPPGGESGCGCFTRRPIRSTAPLALVAVLAAFVARRRSALQRQATGNSRRAARVVALDI